MSLGITSISSMGEKKRHFKIVHFMMEAGVKLQANSVLLATAARIYHRFFMHNSLDDYDPYLIATSCLYLAGKVEEENLRLRDVINVCYRTMYSDKPALDIGSTYWALREAVTQCELVLLRALKFHVSFIHPHKYLLHYIKSLYDWMHPTVVEKFPIGRTAWGILRDSYHGSLSLRYDPEHIAVAALYLSMHSFGIEVPSSQDAEYQWWEALVEDLRIERIRRICKEIMEVYSLEALVAQEALAAPEPETKDKEDDVAPTVEKSPEKDDSVTSISEKMDIEEPKIEAPIKSASASPLPPHSKSPLLPTPSRKILLPTPVQPATNPLPPPIQPPQVPNEEDGDDIYLYLYSDDLKTEPPSVPASASSGKPEKKKPGKDDKIYVPPLF